MGRFVCVYLANLGKIDSYIQVSGIALISVKRGIQLVTTLFENRNRSIEIKYFLNSYRALSDAKSAISMLEELIEKKQFYLSNWKIVWAGACSILRTSVDLFTLDSKSCINDVLREEIKKEWTEIKAQGATHSIYWNFIKRERDNIAHEYKWSAYQAWIGEDGDIQRNALSLLFARDENLKAVILMNDGPYEGRNSLELLKEAADWVEDRIFSAIHRAGFDADEQRKIGDFASALQQRKGLLSLAAND